MILHLVYQKLRHYVHVNRCIHKSVLPLIFSVKLLYGGIDERISW